LNRQHERGRPKEWKARCQTLLKQRLRKPLLALFHELTGLHLHAWWREPAAELSNFPRLCPRAGKLPEACATCLWNRWRPAWNSQKTEQRFTGLCGSINYCACLKVLGLRPVTLVVQQTASASRAGRRAFCHAVSLTRLIIHDLQATLEAGRAAERLESVCERLKRTVPDGDGRPRLELRRGTSGIPEIHTQRTGGSHSLQIVQRMLDYIHEHYSHPMQLNDLAVALGMNATYVSSLFSSTMGVTFHHYLEELRLTRAKDLLQNPLKRVCEVADAVGYCNPNCFRNVFKLHEGISPSAWRERPWPVSRPTAF
jgi:AraC-like DNA-binding protein